MRKMIVKEFTDKSNIEIILEFMKINHGYITLKQITGLGIHRMYLKIMKDICLGWLMAKYKNVQGLRLKLWKEEDTM